jgi:hypothetical protein
MYRLRRLGLNPVDAGGAVILADGAGAAAAARDAGGTAGAATGFISFSDRLGAGAAGRFGLAAVSVLGGSGAGTGDPVKRLNESTAVSRTTTSDVRRGEPLGFMTKSTMAKTRATTTNTTPIWRSLLIARHSWRS